MEEFVRDLRKIDENLQRGSDQLIVVFPQEKDEGFITDSSLTLFLMAHGISE